MARLLILLLLTGVAHAKPVFRPPPPARTDAAELAARLAEAMRDHDTGDIAALLADPMQFDGLWFTDASCAKRFGGRGTVEKGDIRTLAKCLAREKLIATTRRSSLPGGTILTFEPGVEIEVVFKADRVVYAASLWPRDAERGAPTLTVQKFESLRVAGTTQLDAKLAGKITGTATAWIKVCLDAAGTVASSRVLEAKPAPAGDTFVNAIADWQFKPFARGTACSLSLLSYPANSAPAVEVIPASPTPVAVERVSFDDDLVDIFDFSGAPTTGSLSTPQNIPPSLLDARRVHGTRAIEPDAATKATIKRSASGAVTASLKVCADTRGKVNAVSLLKSSGHRAYDRKLERDVRAWEFRPFMVGSRVVPVCSAFTFTYRAR